MREGIWAACTGSQRTPVSVFEIPPSIFTKFDKIPGSFISVSGRVYGVEGSIELEQLEYEDRKDET